MDVTRVLAEVFRDGQCAIMLTRFFHDGQNVEPVQVGGQNLQYCQQVTTRLPATA
jgi:hypothetical protein